MAETLPSPEIWGPADDPYVGERRKHHVDGCRRGEEHGSWAFDIDRGRAGVSGLADEPRYEHDCEQTDGEIDQEDEPP